MNDEFYEMALPQIAKQLGDFQPADLISILYSTTKPPLKKRRLKREMFEICLQSMSLLAQAVKATEIQAKSEPLAEKDHLAALQDLKSSYFDVFRLSKGLIIGPEMKEYGLFNVDD